MALNLQENNNPQGMGMGDDTIVESAPVGMGMGDDTLVEDVTPTPEPTTEQFGIFTPESTEELQVVDTDLADATMSRIYDTHNEGTKNEQLMASANQYMQELFGLGNTMPELGSLVESQKVLYEIYEAESRQEITYDPRSSLTPEQVDGINGNIRRKKKLAEEVRTAMITPQLDVVSIPEGATPDEIKAIQTKVGVKADGIVGPKTLQGIESFNLDQQMEAREAADTQPRIDPQTGLMSEDVTGQGLEDEPIKGVVPTTFISHLNKREGSKETSYTDSLGKLTGGVGHLMTDAEKKKYPKGTKIPKEVRDQWLEEDSAEAFAAAKQQAKELGVTDRKFVEALASVNFQLGTKWNTIHKNTWKLMTEKKFDEAAREAANSTWKRQTPVRVADFQKALTELKG